MLQFLLDCIAPRRSLSGALGVRLTEEERRELFQSEPVQLLPPQLRAMGCRSLDRLVAASTYKHAPLLQQAIHALKYGGEHAYAEELGILLAGAVRLLAVKHEVVLCPVPLHWMRRFKRGCNQSLLLAEVTAELCELPLVELLRRRRPTGHQAWRARRERRRAVRSAFCCTLERVPEHVILVDDVATTGATLEACAKMLKEHGAQRVEGLVVALG